ncbi:MAG TPA: glycoside hydrolase family 2 TIM barrel-domain containing protein [Streptosporangiaceae bacterium]|nr:glycoside hydrolase family 2 TIM barrel-domain containing protein [Streptosporangiaceae bacterium]
MGSPPEERPRPGLSRRTVLAASLAAGAAGAGYALTDLAMHRGAPAAREPDIKAPHSAVAAREYELNTGWRFGRFTDGSELPSHDETGLDAVTLPHCVAGLSWQKWNPESWEHVWVYRRHLDVDGLPPGRVLVDFDGVMVNATVLLNGRVVTSHKGGYLPFTAELTGHLDGGDNLLAVIVDARCVPVPPTSGSPWSVDFFQPGGIYRDVRLRVVPDAYLTDVYARTVDVLSADRRVDVQCTIDSAYPVTQPAQLAAVLTEDSRVVASVTQILPALVPGQAATTVPLTGLGDIKLWSPDRPKLYKLTTTLTVPGVGTHSVRTRIGFRQAEFRVDGFFLNGNRLKIFGLDRHQLFPYTGMAMPARVQRRDAEILRKDFNCNMVRCSHYTQSPHFLDACDELGLMVWEETPGWHHVGDAAWQDLSVQDVQDMVIRDRSRPSVIIWGTRLNETRAQPGFYRRTRDAARRLDGTRPSSGAMYTQHQEGWDEDVYAFNDYHRDAAGNARLLPPLPGVPYLITESVGVEMPHPHRYRWTDPPAKLAQQAVYHAQVHNAAQPNPRYAGLLAWAAFDYASPFGVRGQKIKWAGVADGFRVAKPGAAIYLSQVDPRVRPVVVPVFFWELGAGASPGGPGPDVLVANNCEQVEVFLGDTHAGSGQPILAAELYGHLDYPPTLLDLRVSPDDHPELRIEGYVDGRLVTVVRMSSNPAGDHLVMTADDTRIYADGSDATRVVFRAVDAYGNQRRYAKGKVALQVEGPAELVGDNPFAFGEYGGLGALWLRSQAGRTGLVTVIAEHPALGRARVQVTVRPAGRQRLA